MPNLRFALTAVLLAGTAMLLQARNQREIFPSRQPLAQFPQQLGSWEGTDVPIASDVLDILGPGDFLLRVYQDQTPSQEHQAPEKPAQYSPYVDLFVAYFPSQRAGDTIHSPKHCLPGAGWVPVESSQIELSLPGEARFPANRYVIEKGAERELVIYWYWAHNRGLASEYWAKYYLVADSMRMNRSDGALIRLTTPLETGESVDFAQQRLVSFAGNLHPAIDGFIPR